MTINEDLRTAYLKTTFIAETPEAAVFIRVGRTNGALDDVLRRHGCSSWAFLTAFNPGSVPLGESENQARQHRLEQELRSQGYAFFPAKGEPDLKDWRAERSVLVLGISRDDAVRFGKQYGRNAIVAGNLQDVPILLWIQPEVRAAQEASCQFP